MQLANTANSKEGTSYTSMHTASQLAMYAQGALRSAGARAAGNSAAASPPLQAPRCRKASSTARNASCCCSQEVYAPSSTSSQGRGRRCACGQRAGSRAGRRHQQHRQRLRGNAAGDPGHCAASAGSQPDVNATCHSSGVARRHQLIGSACASDGHNSDGLGGGGSRVVSRACKWQMESQGGRVTHSVPATSSMGLVTLGSRSATPLPGSSCMGRLGRAGQAGGRCGSCGSGADGLADRSPAAKNVQPTELQACARHTQFHAQAPLACPGVGGSPALTKAIHASSWRRTLVLGVCASAARARPYQQASWMPAPPVQSGQQGAGGHEGAGLPGRRVSAGAQPARATRANPPGNRQRPANTMRCRPWQQPRSRLTPFLQTCPLATAGRTSVGVQREQQAQRQHIGCVGGGEDGQGAGGGGH